VVVALLQTPYLLVCRYRPAFRLRVTLTCTQGIASLGRAPGDYLSVIAPGLFASFNKLYYNDVVL
jgi:hypothetical protein